MSGFVGGLTGWRRNMLAAGLGLLMTGALPPYFAIPLLIPAFSGWVVLLAHVNRARDGFVLSWWLGIGHCASAYYWISHSLLVDAAKHGWLVPIAIIGFAAVLGLFPAFCGLIIAWMRGRWQAAPGLCLVPTVLVLAGSWVLLEWVRSWIFTGFPWNLMGTVWTVSPAMMQPAAFGGVYLLSLLTVLAAALPAVMADPHAGSRLRRGFVSLAGIVVLIVGGMWGQWRLGQAAPADAPDVILRLVQPNIAQADKWKRELRAGHVTRQIAMSLEPPAPGQPSPTHVIWAETAVPYLMTATPGLVPAVAEAAPPGGLVLTGALRRQENAPAGQRPDVWNSLHAVNETGDVTATYDKVHLVPFGEFVPFEDLLGFLKVTVGRGNFARGPKLVTLNLAGLPPVAPLICYEAIFPGNVIPEGPRPAWLLNITNDAWFGLSVGPHQHYAAARLRAVEEGLPLVRVANTGISAIVDAYGREHGRLDLGVDGVLDGPLPGALAPTVYARIGHIPVLGAAVLFILIGGFFGKRGRTECSE